MGIEPTLLRTCALSMRLNHSAKTALHVWGCSSLGRAVGSQSAGRGIETPILQTFFCWLFFPLFSFPAQKKKEKTFKKWGNTRIELATSRTLSENHTTRPITHIRTRGMDNESKNAFIQRGCCARCTKKMPTPPRPRPRTKKECTACGDRTRDLFLLSPRRYLCTKMPLNSCCIVLICMWRIKHEEREYIVFRRRAGLWGH